MTEPKVTIVIASYNLAPYVGEAIESALAQTHPNVEVIAVDDGSTDESAEVIARYPIRFEQKKNEGVAYSRNRGAALATGEYLVFLDADDVLTAEYVERCLAALLAAPPPVAYVYTNMQHFGLDHSIFEARPFDRELLLDANYIHVSSLVRKSAFDAAGRWNPRWSVGYEDHELWVRMLAHGYTGKFLPEPLLRYRKRGQSRNALSPETLRRLHTKLMLSQPKLYWSRLLKSPFRALRGILNPI